MLVLLHASMTARARARTAAAATLSAWLLLVGCGGHKHGLAGDAAAPRPDGNGEPPPETRDALQTPDASDAFDAPDAGVADADARADADALPPLPVCDGGTDAAAW